MTQACVYNAVWNSVSTDIGYSEQHNTTQQGCLFANVNFWGSRLPHRSQQWSHSAGGGIPLLGCSFRSESKSLQTPGWRQTSPQRRHRIENTAPGQIDTEGTRNSPQRWSSAVMLPMYMHRRPRTGTQRGQRTGPWQHLTVASSPSGLGPLKIHGPNFADLSLTEA